MRSRSDPDTQREDRIQESDQTRSPQTVVAAAALLRSAPDEFENP